MADSTITVVGTPTTVTVTGGAAQTITAPATPAQTVTVLNAPGPQGPSGASVFRTVHSFAIGGPLAVAAGDTNFIPPFYISKTVAQTVKLLKVVYKISSGTGANVKLTNNGVDIGVYTDISVTTSATSTTPGSPPLLADNDAIALVVNTVTGAPQNLTFTIVLEHTIS